MKTATILIAESHVHTSESDFRIRVKNDCLPIQSCNHLPIEFVRLVYCLGYGNNSVLTHCPEKRNNGTWQFWKLFGAVAERDPYPGSKDWRTKLDWQIATLQELQCRGIWLLDSSLHAIYAPGGKRVEHPEPLHRIWWTRYGKWLLEQISPKQVWAVGKELKSILEGLGVELNGWIYQPNARITSEERNRKLKPLLTACLR